MAGICLSPQGLFMAVNKYAFFEKTTSPTCKKQRSSLAWIQVGLHL